MVPDKYHEVYNFLVERMEHVDYCRFSNVLIGKKLKLQPRTVGRHLTELERLGVIIRTKGAPAHGGFEPGGHHDGKSRRIYLATHPHVQHLRPLELAKEPPPHPYHTRYPDIGNTGHLRKVRHDPALSRAAKLIYGEVVEIAAGGSTQAPPAYYEWANICTEHEAHRALVELQQSGDIYLFQQGTTWFYGTVVGLFESLTMAALQQNRQEVARLKKIVRQHTIYGDEKQMAKAIQLEQHER